MYNNPYETSVGKKNEKDKKNIYQPKQHTNQLNKFLK